MAFASGMFALFVLTITSGIVILGFQIYYTKTAKQKQGENKPKIGSIDFLLSSGIIIFVIIALLLVLLMVFNVDTLF
jgi:uncharacterized membrane protein YidH (DUF202 family)